MPGDQVTFDDTANGTTTVNLTTILSPASISVNDTAKSYTFNGTGALSGPAGLVKNGTSILTIANSGSNNFAGAITIGGGDLQLGADNILPTNAVILADATGVVFDLNNHKQTIGSLSGGGDNGGDVSLGNGTLTLAGSGGNHAGVISGNGQVVVAASGSQVLAGPNLYSGGTLVNGTLTVANTLGSATGSGAVDIEGGTLQFGIGGQTGTVSASVITNNGNVIFNSTLDFEFDNTITGSGSVTKLGLNTVSILVSNSYTNQTTISAGALLISDPNALGTTNGLTTVAGGELELEGGITLLEPLVLNSKGGALNGNSPDVDNLNETNTLAGPVQAVSSGTDMVLQSDNGLLRLTGPFSYGTASSHQIVRLRGGGNGEFHGSIPNANGGNILVELLKQDSGTWTLTSSSTNTYTDTTQIQGGTLLVDGSILASSSVQVNSATLGGFGFIASPVSLSGATLSPGDPGIGTLTISNTLVLDGGCTCVFDVSESGSSISNDQVTGLVSVTYAGVLQVNLTGTPVGGEVFHLFKAATYNAAFDGYNLPALTSPLAWDTSQLAVDGTLRIVNGNVIKIESSTFQSDGSFQLSGTGIANQTYRVLATTDLTQPVGSWTQVGSGSFNGGAFTFTDSAASSFPTRFYLVVSP